MNKLRFLHVFLLSNLFLSQFLYSSINELSEINVSTKRFAPQIFMSFTKPLYFEKSINNQKMELQLDFPGMDLNNFKKNNIVSKIKQLNHLIKDVKLFYKKVPSPRVVLLITFSSKNILVRWYKLEDPGKPDRLVLDIYNKKNLRKLHNTGGRLLYTQNDVSKKKTDFSSLINLGQPYKKLANKDPLILIDAGHGGIDDGAKGFFLLKEKDIVLDISRRVSHSLKKNGFKTHLTRTGDENLTLLERSELAAQLKADLFVSIHVNASRQESSRGIETYYLKKNNILPPHRSGGFFFILEENDLKLANFADKYLNNNIQLSKRLALFIHNNVLMELKKSNMPSFNRGMKRHTFRVLLSEVPVILIEVGFVTNKEEAKRLTMPKYRQILANGITKGIKQYLYSK